VAERISINRAPVLTLWAAVVAERLGHDRSAALSLGKALAGLNAQSKGRLLGIYGPAKARGERPGEREAGGGEELWVELCGRSVPARMTPGGLRAVKGSDPVDSEAAERYLSKSFGEHYQAARAAMESLAACFTGEDLAARAYGLYERFRPQVPPGRTGWGARGELDLALVRSLGKPR
jgi:hypothetical protein